RADRPSRGGSDQAQFLRVPRLDTTLMREMAGGFRGPLLPTTFPVMPLLFRENVPLAPYVSFRVGGPARWFCEPASAEEFREARAFARERGVPAFVLGNGSNLVISDAGFPGL